MCIRDRRICLFALFCFAAPGGQCPVEKGRSVLLQTIFSFFQEEIPILSTIKVKDLVDVAILSLVIYKALWLMRKTSSGRGLRGITVLILALCLAYGFRLTATGYLLNKVVEWGILMLVILFQPELRQALELSLIHI